MSIRAYILIQLENGQTFRYVRDESDGEDGIYYKYGDTAGDTYLVQGDSTQIKYAFDAITDDYIGDSNTTRFILFPESAGDTYLVVRNNYNVPVGAREAAEEGDTQFITPTIKTKISAKAIQSISIVEERLDAWFSDNY
jgi:hypothetical protein